jgi:GT2 family glycosyltransferase
VSALPLVSVIVPIYNDEAGLAKLLAALDAQHYRPFECILIDNGSTRPLRAPSDLTFDIRVIQHDLGGGFAARNRGIREARGSILAFTDADCMPAPSWLANAVARLRSAETLALVGGKIEVVSEGPTPASAYEWHSLVHDLDQARYLASWHFAATANLVVRREVFAAVGEFDDTLMSGGDFEWGRRAWSSGVAQIYADDAVVLHPTRTTWRSLVVRHRRLIGGQYMMSQRAGRSRTDVVRLIFKTAWLSANRAMRDARMSIPDRLKVTALDATLRGIQLVEVVRLSLGGHAERR